MKNYDGLRARLKEKLEENKLSARAACLAAGLSTNFLSQVFSGTIKRPHPKKIDRLAPILGITYE